MGCTSGDYERELEASSYHCWVPGGGGVFLPSHNKIHDTHTWKTYIFTFFTWKNCGVYMIKIITDTPDTKNCGVYTIKCQYTHSSLTHAHRSICFVCAHSPGLVSVSVRAPDNRVGYTPAPSSCPHSSLTHVHRSIGVMMTHGILHQYRVTGMLNTEEDLRIFMSPQ